MFGSIGTKLSALFSELKLGMLRSKIISILNEIFEKVCLVPKFCEFDKIENFVEKETIGTKIILATGRRTLR